MCRTFIVIFLVVIAFATTSTAQQREKQVVAAVETLRKAMVDGDKEALENIAAAALSYGHSSGQLDTKKDFVEKLTNGTSDFVTIELSEQTVALSGDTAIVRHTLTADTNDGGKPGKVKLKVLLVWQKLGGKWKLLARQAVRAA